MQRVVVVGGPGSGKSRTAARLAGRLRVPNVELDGLWWDGDWRAVGRDELRRRVEGVVAGDGWVLDGNYIDEVADLVWPRADAIVWLDPPRRLAVARALRRSARRAMTRTVLWNGNRQSATVLGPKSVARLIQRWPAYNVRIAKAVEDLNPTIIRLRSDEELESWLEGL